MNNFIIILFLFLITYMITSNIQNKKRINQRKNKIMFFDLGLDLVKKIQYQNNYMLKNEEIVAIHNDLLNSDTKSDFYNKIRKYSAIYLGEDISYDQKLVNDHSYQSPTKERPKLYLIKNDE